jgi:hypothetical protein
MSIAVEDWDDLSAAPRRRDKQAPAEQAGGAPATGRKGVAPADWDELSTARRRRRDRNAATQQAEETPASEEQELVATDWDDLAPARRRRREPATDQADRAERAPATRAHAVIGGELEDPKDFEYDDAENLRPMLSVAGGNIAIWALAHLTGVVELIGVSFLASVGLLLAAYVLREWHRDRAALVCLVGGLPLPVTIFSLLT